MKAPDFEEQKDLIFCDQDGEITMTMLQTKQILNDYYNKSKAYVDRTRRYGEGSLRIGSGVELSEDIYCITYLSMLRADHISVYLNIETGQLTEQHERDGIRAIIAEKRAKEVADSKVASMA